MFLDDLKARKGLYRKIATGKRLTKKEQEDLSALRDQYGISADGTVSTQEALAELLGVTRHTIIRWKKDGMPVEIEGGYDPIKVLEWNVDLSADSEIELNHKMKWDIEYRKFRAKLAELQYEQDAGKLIEVDLVKDLLINRAVEIKKSLLSRGRRLSPRLAHKSSEEIIEILDEDTEEILRIYSRPSDLVKAEKTEAGTEE